MAALPWCTAGSGLAVEAARVFEVWQPCWDCQLGASGEEILAKLREVRSHLLQIFTAEADATQRQPLLNTLLHLWCGGDGMRGEHLVSARTASSQLQCLTEREWVELLAGCRWRFLCQNT